MDATIFMPRHYLASLREMYAKGFGRVYEAGNGNPDHFEVNTNYPNKWMEEFQCGKMTAKELSAKLSILEWGSENIVNAMGCGVFGQMLLEGPKCFRPNDFQCEAMRRVNLSLPTMDFRAPFDNLVILWPKEFRARLTAEFGNEGSTPFATIVSLRSRSALQPPHEWKETVLTTLSCYHEAQYAGQERITGFIVGYMPIREGRSIDTEMAKRFSREELNKANLKATDEEVNQFEVTSRTALNLAMLLAGEKTRTQPLEPKEHAKHTEQMRSKDPEKRARATTFRADSFSEIVPEHDIVFAVGSKGERYTTGEGATGWTVRAHWRRGHWRKLDPAKGHFKGEWRRKFIASVLIHKDDLEDGAVVEANYRS